MRYGKPDGNQRAIVRALKDAGRSVQLTTAIGGGFPDAVVGWPGGNVLMEFKADKGELNEAQTEFFRTWKGPKVVVRTVAEALAATGVWVRRA